MSSKIDRWKNIAANSQSTSGIVNSNKSKLIDELAMIPILNEPEITEEVGVEDRSIFQEYTSGVDVESINQEYIPAVQDESTKVETSFVQRVNQDLSQFIENKTTKEQTHKKTSILLRNDLRMKLANFDAANGGRAKGLLMNFLLDDFFADLEASDPKWQKILSRKIPNFK